nr:hypothetical protein [Deltaproteobacteria bacterium]
MSPRVGTIAALVAAALLAISIATSAWWSGSPTLDGKHYDRKTANIGLITASQCNYDPATDVESECRHLKVGGHLAITKWVQVGLTGLLLLSLLGFAISRRRGFGKLVMLTVAASAVMSVVLLALGPNLKTGKEESMPIGFSMVLFFSGTAFAIVTGIVSMLPERKRPSFRQLPSQLPAPQPGFDVQALLAEDALHPANLGPEPMMGRPQSPGGMLPGPAGPLVPPSGPHASPLFQSAPQL